jgi:hypothetical protein
VLSEIRRRTRRRTDVVNFLTLSHYVTTRLAQRTSHLHQDFDLDYRLSGDHLDSLNFWIPLVKPERERSNLSLIPFDALRGRSGQAYQAVHGGGGLRWIPEGGTTAVYGNQGAALEATSEPLYRMDFQAEELVVTPLTQSGDLVLMRGDLPHRTQDQDTVRVAASIRATFSGKLLRSERATCSDGDPAAAIMEMLRRCCATLGRDEVTVAELVDFAQGRR